MKVDISKIALVVVMIAGMHSAAITRRCRSL